MELLVEAAELQLEKEIVLADVAAGAICIWEKHDKYRKDWTQLDLI